MARKQDRISAEALDAYLAGNPYNSEEASVFFHEALDNGAEIYEGRHDDYLYVIARIPEFYKEGRHSTRVGIYFSVNLRLKEINAWEAYEQETEFRDGYSLLDDESLTESYRVLLDKAIGDFSTCDFCKEVVIPSTLRLVGFCNKACPKCYDEAKAKIEVKGWCN